MPVYTYQGQKYTTSETDPRKALERIKALNVPKNTPEQGTSTGQDYVDILKGGANVFQGSLAGIAGVGHAARTGGGAEAQNEFAEAVMDKNRWFQDEGGKRAEQFISEKMEQGKDVFGRVAEAGRDYMRMNPLTAAIGLGTSEHSARGAGELTFETIADPTIPGSLVSAGRAAGVASGKRGVFKDPPPAPPPVDPMLQRAQEIAQAEGRTTVTRDDLHRAQAGGSGLRMPEIQTELPTAGYTEAEVMAQRQQAAQGEMRSMYEQQQWLREQETGTRDMFDQYSEPTLSESAGTRRNRPDGFEYGLAEIEPLAQTPMREAPEAGALPEGTAPLQGELFTDPQAALEMPAQGAVRMRAGVLEQPPYVAPKEEMSQGGAMQGELPFTKGPDQMDAVKEPGGNWFPEAGDSFKRALGDVTLAEMRPELTLPEGKQWIEHVDKIVDRYIHKYAGTGRDPLKDIEVPFGAATIRWEELTDTVVAARNAGSYRKFRGTDWLHDKIPDAAPIWDVNRNSPAMRRMAGEEGLRISTPQAMNALNSYLRHVRDYVDMHVRPEDLPRYDLVRMVKETAEWDKQMAKKMEKARMDSMKNMTIHKEYPDGYKWVKLDRPGQFAQESDAMGHSVRGYEPEKGTPDWEEAANHVPLGVAGHHAYGLGGWDAIKSGAAEIYSLRDEKGMPHVTIEVQAGQRTNSLYEQNLQQFGLANDGRATQPSITQIKGKQNRAPEARYQKYVQDFVRSREWGDIGDLQNTGMRMWEEFHAQVADAEQMSQEVRQDMFDKADEHFGSPAKYVTSEEWIEFYSKYSGNYIKRQHDAISKRIAEAFDGNELPVPKNNDFNRTLADLIKENDSRGALAHIAEKSSNPFYRWLADALLLDDKFAPKVTVYEYLLNNKGNGWASGAFSPAEGIKMSRAGDWHGSEQIFLHESIHARVSELQYRHMAGVSVPEALKKHLDGLDSLYKWVKEQMPKDQKAPYGMTNFYEFLSEGFSNPDFQKFMEGLTLPRDFFFEQKQKGIMSAFKGFIHHILSILRGMGFKQINGDAPNAISVFMNEGAELLRQLGLDPKLAAVAYGPQGLAWNQMLNMQFDAPGFHRKAPKVKPESYAEFRKKLEGEESKAFVDRFGKALYDQYMEGWRKDNEPLPRPIGYDNRGHDDFRKDLYRSDGSPRLDDVGYVFPAGTAYTQAEAHPVIRRVYDSVSQASVEKANLFNKWYRGASILDKGTFNPMKLRFTAMSSVKKVESPDSVGALSSSLNKKEKQAIIDLLNTHGTDSPQVLLDEEVLRANKASPKVIKFLKSLNEANKEALGEINKVRVSKGLEPIKDNPGWWITRVRYGSYQVFAIGADGKHTYLAGFDNMADAEKVAASLKAEKGMEVVAAPNEANPRHLEILPSDAFMQAANMIDDPALRQRLRDSAAEAIKRTGVNKYALPRDSRAGGYAGSPELVNTLGIDKAWQGVADSVEHYFRQAANYVGSHEAGQKVGSVFVDDGIKNDYPNALRKARFMWDQYVGVPRPLDELLRTASKAVGTLPVLKNFVDERTGHKVLSGAGNLFTTINLVWLNPVFYLANHIQGFVVPSRMQELNTDTFGDRGNIAEALLRAQQHMHLPTEYSKKIMHEAMENGSLEAKFAEALDWAQSEERMVPRAIKYTMGEKVAAYSDSYSRGKAYMAFFELAKSAGETDVKAHSFAARESQGIMIQYERWARMPVLNALGPVGDAVAPLTTFITNQAFNLARYMKDATVGKNGKRLVAPLLTLLGLQIAIAGIRGLPGYEDLERQYNSLNQYYIKEYGAEPLPTPSEWLAHVPSVLQDGVYSEMMGIQASGTLGMGTIGGNVGQMVGLEYAWNTISGFYAAAMQPFNMRMTSQEVADETKKIVPPLAREGVDALLNERNPLEPRGVKQGGQLVYQRDQKEQTAALLTGRTPLNESRAKRAKAENEGVKAAIGEAKTQARELFVEHIMTGKEIGRFGENVLKNYPDVLEGLADATYERIMKQNIPYYERQIMTNRAKARYLELLERTHANVRK